VLSGLTLPLFVTSARDGTDRLFVVEQGGLIKVFGPGQTTPKTFLDISTKVLVGGERGLLSLAFHPQIEAGRRFFISYNRPSMAPSSSPNTPCRRRILMRPIPPKPSCW
jgi:hypothetical protein